MELEGALAVQCAVRPVQPPDSALSTTMIPAVLAADEAVQVEVYAEAVFATVLDSAEEVAPCDLGHVGFVVFVEGLDGPVGVLDADVVEACVTDVDEVLLSYEFGVVFLEGCVCGVAEALGQCVFVDDTLPGIVFVEEGWDNEGFDGEPAAEVYAADWLGAVGEGFVKRGNVFVCLGRIVPAAVQAH